MAQPFALSMKVVIRDESGRCLVIRRAMQSRNNAGKWDFPGGKVDPGERFDDALVREVREETGLEIELARVAGHAQSQAPGRMVVYLIMEAKLLGGTTRLSEEHTESAWVEANALPRLDLCPQFEQFARDYARFQAGTNV